MAHYAKVIDGVVKNVIVAEPEFFETFIDDSPGEWIQTSYNTHKGKHWTYQEDGTRVESEDQSKALRANFAGIGFVYDVANDVFYPPQRDGYDSWTISGPEWQWEPPVARPDDGLAYDWDEDAYQADTSDPKTAGWVLRPNQ